jgi:serine/threonine-protein kinase
VSGPSFELSTEALGDEERGRLRVTAQVLIGIACLGLALAPILGGDPFAKKVFVTGLVWAVIMMGWLLRNSYVSSYNGTLVGAGGVSLALASTCTLYFIGPFSQATMTGALGLYVFCMGRSARWAAAVYAALAVPHAVLAALIICGVISDRGLVNGSTLSVSDQTALHGCAQAVYAIAFLAGRASRLKLERVLGDLERSTRVIAQRDALFNEARRELERAVWGAEGRFTDQVIGSFRLGDVIGRGGMGDVYEAVHVETQAEAAVKLLHRNVLDDATNIERLVREAQSAARVDSAHVVRIVEVSDARAPLPYLAMERLRGEDLASMLRREHRLSTRDLLELVQQVGRGLDAAWAAGVIHRDIKPQNLFLARVENGNSVWKILDFGMSKQIGQASLTQNQLVGTVEYMAPEQAAGGALDQRADLYGMCAVLYRCLASRTPFVEQSVPAIVHKLLHEMPVRPSSVARVSSDLEAFLAIGLAKDPCDRYASGVELSAACAAAVAGTLPAALHARAERILARTPWTEI